MIYSHEDKAKSLFDYYSGHFGAPRPREMTLDWQALGLDIHDLRHLEDSFTEEEVVTTIIDGEFPST
jgi:hypothetical protein